jgi:hypothetical protein
MLLDIAVDIKDGNNIYITNVSGRVSHEAS